MNLALASFLLFVVGAGLIYVWLRNSGDQSLRRLVNWGGHGTAARTREERLVATHILSHADDPDSVEFVEWGPHALAGNADDGALLSVDALFFGTATRNPSSKLDAIIRIRFRCKQAESQGKAQYDELMGIVNGKVFADWGSLTALLRTHGRFVSGIPGGVPNFSLASWKEKMLERMRRRESESKVDALREAEHDEPRRKEGPRLK